MRRVLIAADGPETTARVAAYARQVREREPEAEFTVASVAVPAAERGSTCPALLDIPLSFGLERRMKADAVNYARQTLEQTAGEFDRTGVPASFVLLVGNPSTELAQYAARHDVDEIVIGTRKSGLIQTILGRDPARAVAAQAGCTVTVIRPN